MDLAVSLTELMQEYPDVFFDCLCLSSALIGTVIGLIGGVVIFTGCFLSDLAIDKCLERRLNKSGKLTNEQRLDFLESKIDSIADIVISSSEEVK